MNDFTVVEDKTLQNLKKIIKEMDERFSSGNDIEIDRVWLRKQVWLEEIKPVLQAVTR